MYFSNLQNEELQQFHNMIGAHFSMSLSDIIQSKLFKIEEIITDRIYRIYPLFYCKNIISSNPNDRILDTRCLILQKTGNETYLSFITDEINDNIVLNEEILSIKNIKDKLSSDEFNALVYRLRQKGNIVGNLNFEDSDIIAGVYATYQFNNVSKQLRNDAGIIVNDKVKNNPLTVKLIDPFFLNAKYTLIFTVRSINGANVCEENKKEFISKDSFSIDLVEGSEVAIPLNDYVNDSVLDFNVSVSISFNVPEIVNSNFILELTSNYDNIFVDETLTLTATLIGEDNLGGYVVEFFEDNNLIGSQTTDNQGKAILNYSPNFPSNHLYSARALGLSNELNVLVNKITPIISLETNSNKVIQGNSFTLTGVLNIGENKTVEIYNGNTLIDIIITGSGGRFSKTITAGVDVYRYKAVFQGDTKHNKTSSNQVNQIVVLSDDCIECKVLGNSLREYVGWTRGFYNADGEKVIFDYGDGTFEVNDMYRHDYTDGLSEHTMKIYNVTNLRSNAFNRCPISYIKFNQMDSVGTVFYCNRLVTVEIPDGVKYLNGFSNSNLKNINIPSTITSLSDSCFAYDTNLKSLNIPKSVNNIGISCFYACSGLEVIYFNWETSDEILSYVSNWFYGTSNNLKFSIPPGTTQLYTAKGYPAGKLIERG